MKRLVCHLTIITMLMVYGIITINGRQTKALSTQRVSVTFVSEDGGRKETYHHICGIEYHDGFVQLQYIGGTIDIDSGRFEKVEVTKEEWPK